MRNFVKSHWKTIAALGAIAAFVLTSLIAMGWDPFGFKDGRLVAPTIPALRPTKRSQFEPNGNDSATVVSIENKGGRSCLIQSVIFKPEKQFPTPDRIGLAGAALTLPVNFTSGHYDREDRTFTLRFRRPESAPAGEWANLEVAIVEPAWVGNTYVGTLTVIYNGDKRIVFRSVELDVLGHTPLY